MQQRKWETRNASNAQQLFGNSEKDHLYNIIAVAHDLHLSQVLASEHVQEASLLPSKHAPSCNRLRPHHLHVVRFLGGEILEGLPSLLRGVGRSTESVRMS